MPRDSSGGFEDWSSLDELFPTLFQGVNPNRGLEGSLIDTDLQALASRMRAYFSDMSFARLQERYPVLTEQRAGYAPERVRNELRQLSGGFKEEQIVPYMLFPLDDRLIYYEPQGALLNRRRPELWENLEGNTFLVTVPQPRRVSESRPLLATSLFDLHLHDRGSLGFPVYVRPEVRPHDLFSLDAPQSDQPLANLAKPAWAAMARAWSLTGDLEGDAAKELVRRLFNLTLALAHAPQYEADHKDSLAQDWIHLPIPKDAEVLARAASLGETVGTLLNPLSDAANALRMLLGSSRRSLAVVGKRGGGAARESELVVTFSYYGGAQGGWRDRAPRPDEASRPEWGERTGDLFLNEDVFLSNVPERVWRYELGGYPVIKKWLGYRDAGRRPGQPLSLAELEHLRGMVHRIAALLLLHESLDRSYEQAITDPFTAEDLGLR